MALLKFFVATAYLYLYLIGSSIAVPLVNRQLVALTNDSAPRLGPIEIHVEQNGVVEPAAASNSQSSVDTLTATSIATATTVPIRRPIRPFPFWRYLLPAMLARSTSVGVEPTVVLNLPVKTSPPHAPFVASPITKAFDEEEASKHRQHNPFRGPHGEHWGHGPVVHPHGFPTPRAEKRQEFFTTTSATTSAEFIQDTRTVRHSSTSSTNTAVFIQDTLTLPHSTSTSSNTAVFIQDTRTLHSRSAPTWPAKLDDGRAPVLQEPVEARGLRHPPHTATNKTIDDNGQPRNHRGFHGSHHQSQPMIPAERLLSAAGVRNLSAPIDHSENLRIIVHLDGHDVDLDDLLSQHAEDSNDPASTNLTSSAAQSANISLSVSPTSTDKRRIHLHDKCHNQMWNWLSHYDWRPCMNMEWDDFASRPVLNIIGEAMDGRGGEVTALAARRVIVAFVERICARYKSAVIINWVGTFKTQFVDTQANRKHVLSIDTRAVILGKQGCLKAFFRKALKNALVDVACVRVHGD